MAMTDTRSVRPPSRGRAALPAGQPRLDALGQPLHDVTFVVLDLETTGGAPASCRITEVGAVKVRRGERLGEFATLVDPQQDIPAEITALTGITNAMTSVHPPIEAVLPALLEFVRGAVIVAHNARFDIGFLNASLDRLAYPRLDNPVVCTAALARRLVRDEVRNCRLATLAAHLRARTVPTHRALADARATVDVFHALLERAGSYGVVTLEDLVEFSSARNAPLFRARAVLANHLPRSPGVYAFTSESGEVLYVGKATDLRARVRTYFGSDDRRWVADMVKETAVVQHWPTPTAIEAEARELRLIHDHRPRFNRRSKHPEKAVWLKLTGERFPRLAIVRQPRDDGAAYLGPLRSRRVAEEVRDAIHEVTPIRRCTAAIGASTRFPACALAEMGRCVAPCDGRVAPADYAAVVEPIAAAFAGDVRSLATLLFDRMQQQAAQARFEDAARTRNRLRAVIAAAGRSRRLAWIATAGPVIAARATRDHRRQVVAVRSGALVASADVRADELDDVVSRLHEKVAYGASMIPCSADEQDLVARWLEGAGVTVLRCDGRLAEPWLGGAAIAAHERPLRAASRSTGRPAAELARKRVRRTAAVG